METYDPNKSSKNQSNQFKLPNKYVTKSGTRSFIAQNADQQYSLLLKMDKEEKQRDRMEFFSILERHNATRSMIETAKQKDRKLLEDRWMKSTRKVERQRLKDFIGRLSANKNINTQVPKISQQSNCKLLKSKEPKKSARSKMENQSKIDVHVLRRNVLLEDEIARYKDMADQQLQRTKKVRENKEMLLERKMRLSKETREKKILKAKVRLIMENEIGLSCRKFKQNSLRFASLAENSNENDGIIDEIFLEKFNDDELKQIIEDQNYFIPYKEERDRISFLSKIDPMKLDWEFTTAR